MKNGNDSQKQAVSQAKSNVLTLVHGPPGTGKTEGTKIKNFDYRRPRIWYLILP